VSGPHDSVNAYVRKRLQLCGKLRYLVEPYAKTSHAGVNFQVNISNHVALARGAIEGFNQIEPVNNGDEVLLQT
jgi:hypothetical protein